VKLLRAAARRAGRELGRVVPRLREWEYVPEGWERRRADPQIKGWDEAAVLEAYKAKLAVFANAVEGTGPIGLPTSAAFRDVTPTVKDQGIVLGFAYTLALSSRKKDTVSILDWGGGVGLFYLLSRALLPSEVELDYHCKDLPALCSYGREALPEAHFHEDESCLERRYDLVVASSSLQYSENWSEVLHRLAGVAAGYLYLARVPVVLQAPSFVVLQRAQRYGLGTEFLSWVFNRDEILSAASSAGAELLREFVFGEKSEIRGSPEQDETRGFLFRAGDPRSSTQSHVA
jgi:putative methyltransferase (TIGR04325 family)